MIIIGLILAIVALIFLCWLLFSLAVYALPCFVGLSAGLWVLHHDSGVTVAIAAGLCAGVVALALGRLAFTYLRAPTLRILVALAFVAPAGLAGFYTALGLGRNFGAAPPWADVIAGLGALMVGGTAFARIAVVPVQVRLANPATLAGSTVAARS
jgi:hypothetical protein